MAKPCKHCGSNNTYVTEEGFFNNQHYCKNCQKYFDAPTVIKDVITVGGILISAAAGIDTIHHNHPGS